ncbi:MAG: hypothetical protein WD847_03050 [Pirellulales bacterium]
MRAALLLLACKGFGWSGTATGRDLAAPRIDPLQFALLWPIVLLVVVSGAVTFAWLGFAIWLAPFCRWFSG